MSTLPPTETNPPSGGPQPVDRWHAYRWPLVILALAWMGLVAFLVSIYSTKSAVEATYEAVKSGTGALAKQAVSIAEAFQQGSITETFTAAIPSFSSVPGGRLELATAQATETFSRTDSRTVAWDLLDLGTTSSEIKVPVTYRYHLRLNDEWRIEVHGQTCIVHAPKIRPSLPPAIHTDRMEKRVEQGWGRFNAANQMSELERSLTPELTRYALNRRHIDLVREPSRKIVADFIRNWLLTEDHWRMDRFRAIHVVFADEEEQESIPEPGPVIEFQEVLPPVMIDPGTQP